jgi:two-component system chemotaxis response regulator CheB
MGKANRRRDQMKTERDLTPTVIGCPDCSGVLRVTGEGPQEHLHYTCVVGHSFSLNSLLEAKEDQVEQALWSIVSLLQHVGMICTELKKQSDSELTRQLDVRIAQVKAHENMVREIITKSDPPALELGQAASGSSQRRRG